MNEAKIKKRKPIHAPLPWAGVYDDQKGTVTLLDGIGRAITVLTGDMAVLNGKYIITLANAMTGRKVSIDESQEIIDTFKNGARSGRPAEAAI